MRYTTTADIPDFGLWGTADMCLFCKIDTAGTHQKKCPLYISNQDREKIRISNTLKHIAMPHFIKKK